MIEKRERERIILGMFKKEGTQWRQRDRTAREMLNGVEKVEKVQPPQTVPNDNRHGGG